MVAFKLRQFGGMIPAVDPRLLPENNAEFTENAWLYTGSVAGLHTPKTLLNLSAGVTKVFRIPKEYYDKDHMADSYWMQFTDPDTDVIKSPTIEDQFERFYWTSRSTGPYYNTKARIIAGNTGGNAPFKLGIPAPAVAPRISRISGVYPLVADRGTYNIAPGTVKLFLTENYGIDRQSFYDGLVDYVNKGAFGATTATRTIGGVSRGADNSGVFVADYAPNAYEVSGGKATLQYKTQSAGHRITISDGDVITIGVPAQPLNSPSYVGIGVLEARAYVYTWVSAYGEEGPPSPPTLATGYSGDPWNVRLTAPTSGDTTDRNLTKVRIYRTVTGVGGSTTYFLVKELDIATLTYTDTASDLAVTANSILASTFWSAPPSDLAGFVSMPNGIVAGFKGNEVWFSEPYRPHAWPGEYAVAVATPIVGMGVVGQTLIVLTHTAPYAITGINPASMTVSRLKQTEPCMSRGSIVSTTTGVAYVSPNGLAIATPAEVQVVTRSLISKDKWQDLIHVDSFRAAAINGAYYGFGSVATGCFEETAFETDTAFLKVDYSGSYTGIMVDLNDQRIGVNTLRRTTPTDNIYTDVWTDEVFIVTDGKLLWLDISEVRPHDPFIWRSKIFELPNKRNLEALRVWYTVPQFTPDQNPVPVVSPTTLAADMHGIIRVYADERLVFSREMRSSGEFMRLPSGFKATFWQVEVEARVQVNNIEAATTAKELMNV